MYTWLSRFMTFVFLFNVLSPAYAQETGRRNAAPQQDSSSPRYNRRPADPNYSPAMLEAQKQRDLAQQAKEQVLQSRQEYLDSVAPRLEEAAARFSEATTFEEMSAAYQQLNQIRKDGDSAVQRYNRDMMASSYTEMARAGDVGMTYYTENHHVAPDAISQTLGYDARLGSDPRKWPQWAAAEANLRAPASVYCPSSANFLEEYKKNQLSLKDLLEYIDPMGFNCTDYLAVAYAAEVLYYMLEAFTEDGSLSEEEQEEMTVFLSQLRYRASMSLKRLNAKDEIQTEEIYMARGTLRILLAMLQRVAQANHLQLAEKKLYLVSPTKKLWQNNYPQQTNKPRRSVEGRQTFSFNLPNSRPSFEQFEKENTYVFESVPEEAMQSVEQGYAKVQEVTYSSFKENPLSEKFRTSFIGSKFLSGNTEKNNLPQGAVEDPFVAFREGMPGNLGEQFYDELVALRKDKPGQDSKEFTLLQLVTQYAAQYAVLTGNDSLLDDILRLFEEKSNTDFNTHYSQVLASLFNGIYETLRGFNVRSTYAPVFSFLIDAAKDSHSTDTRVLALATLGRLTEQTNSTSEPHLRAEFVIAEDGNRSNKYWLSYEDRFYLAKYTADLYEPLNNTSNYGMESYGLKSDEMLSLSNELAGIYMQFLPMEAPTVTLGRCGHVDNVDMDNRRIITAGDLQQTLQGEFRDADCQFYYTNGGVFVFGGRRGWVEMTKLNHINSRKYTQEITNKGMEIFGEALMWVFGGALIGSAFRGLRLLYGVTKALPRAWKAGKFVYRTTKGARTYRMAAGLRRANASLKTGSKYMSNFNFQNHLAQNGMAYSVTTKAAEPGLVRTTSAVTHGGMPYIPAPTTRVTLTAADAASGLARQATFGVSPTVARWSNPVMRAQLERFAFQQGLGNTWTAADRIMYQRSMMWRNAYDKLWNDFAVGKLVNPREPFVFPQGVTLPYYPGAVLAENPIAKALWLQYWNTWRFFAGWEAGDFAAGLATRDSFNGWMAGKQEEAVKAEMDKHGDSFSDEAMAEIEAQNSGEGQSNPGDILGRVGGTPKEGFSWYNWLTFPSEVWQTIAPADPDATDGSLILPPFMEGRWALFNMGVGSNPFINDAVKSQLAINAHQMDLGRARIGQANTALGEGAENILAGIAEQRTALKENIVTLKAQYPNVNWSADERELLGLFDAYDQAVAATKSISDLSERSRQLTAVVDQYNGQLNTKFAAFDNKYGNVIVAQMIEDFTIGQEDAEMAFKDQFVHITQPALFARMQNMYTQVLDGLKKVQRTQFSSVNEKIAACDKYILAFNQGMEALNKELQLSDVISAENDAREELYPNESSEFGTSAY